MDLNTNVFCFLRILQILGGLLNPSGGYVHVKKPRSFVFQNPDHQVDYIRPITFCLYIKSLHLCSSVNHFIVLPFVWQVVMPTVEADVAFGLGKFNIANDEITSRVADALDAVGMYEYLQVCQKKLYIFSKETVYFFKMS